jgi:uncharacterized protein DUF4236
MLEGRWVGLRSGAALEQTNNRSGREGGEMGFSYRRRIRLGRGSWMNVSKGGASLSSRRGCLTLNSRGGGSVRVARGLSYRFGRRR